MNVSKMQSFNPKYSATDAPKELEAQEVEPYRSKRQFFSKRRAGIIATILVISGLVGAVILSQRNTDVSQSDSNSDSSVEVLESGLTVQQSSSAYIVNSGGGLEVKISRSTCDLTSIKFDGIEMQSSTSGKYSHIRSGLKAKASLETDYSTFAKISCASGVVTHYMIFHGKSNDILMGTHASAIDYSELRFLLRLKMDIIDQCPKENDIRGATVIEGSDVFRREDGSTACKYFSARRVVDSNTFGARSNKHNFGVYFVVEQSGLETGVGGPFFKDIEQQCTDTTHEISHYMNSDHVRSEDYRVGFHGPYSVSFRRGTQVPHYKEINFDLMARYNLKEYTPRSSRGYVAGVAILTEYGKKFEHTIGFRNAQAQYWTKVVPSNNYFSGPWMKPGAYEMTLYRGELEVAKQTVVVNKGQRTVLNIRNLEDPPSAIFRIGEPDGKPLEFLNGDKILWQHPTDVRMGNWSPPQFVVGKESSRSFPLGLFKEGQEPGKIQFSLDTAQSSTNHKVSIAITHSSLGARPRIELNGRWSGPIVAAPAKIDSRAITRGSYRGYNVKFDFEVPASAFNTGLNTLTINVISGSSGAAFLSPNFIIDYIELI